MNQNSRENFKDLLQQLQLQFYYNLCCFLLFIKQFKKKNLTSQWNDRKNPTIKQWKKKRTIEFDKILKKWIPIKKKLQRDDKGRDVTN